MDPHRTERVAETLRLELEELINYELADPRITSVAVTEVLISPDMRKAHVRLAPEGTAREQVESLQAIEKASGYLRRQLAERLDLFRVPELRFVSDMAVETRSKSHNLLKKIRKGRPRD